MYFRGFSSSPSSALALLIESTIKYMKSFCCYSPSSVHLSLCGLQIFHFFTCSPLNHFSYITAALITLKLGYTMLMLPENKQHQECLIQSLDITITSLDIGFVISTSTTGDRQCIFMNYNQAYRHFFSWQKYPRSQMKS